jgi:hypothetical protein
MPDAPPPMAPMKVAELADVLCLKERRVYRLVQQGIIPHPKGGWFDPVACIQGYVAYLKGDAEGARLDARTRRETALADKAELSVERTKREMIEEATRVVAAAAVEERLAFERWPERVAALIGSELGCCDPEHVHAVMESHIREFLTERARGPNGNS